MLATLVKTVPVTVVVKDTTVKDSYIEVVDVLVMVTVDVTVGFGAVVVVRCAVLTLVEVENASTVSVHLTDVGY